MFFMELLPRVTSGHPVGSSVNFTYFEDMRKLCLGFTMVVNEKV